MNESINGIQQIGIGVHNTKEVFNWYRKHLGFDILLFKDEATASLMTKYTLGEPQRRDAYLALNMLGGGGLEIWQFKDRVPQGPEHPIQWGDLGINAMKVRTLDIQNSHAKICNLKVSAVTDILKSSYGERYFYFNDPWNNTIQLVEDAYAFSSSKTSIGGVLGAVIGVSDMDTSIRFYKNLLGYTNMVCDEEIFIPKEVSGTVKTQFRKVVLKHSRKGIGGFAELLGPTQIELLQALDRKPEKIYKNRLWGDLGYIHICFDVKGMDILREKAKAMKHPFTVDSAQSFDMGDAAGHFSYVEDPDGTLIELVETHKVPILKKLGLYLNLKNRKANKPLPKWLVKTLRFHRITKDV